jgi:histidine triad (HIT) family protein
MSFVIPLNRLREAEALLAFHHPKPSHTVHILLVLKRAITSMLDITSTDDVFLHDLFETVQSLVHGLRLDRGGYSFISNGGDYQDVPQLTRTRPSHLVPSSRVD